MGCERAWQYMMLAIDGTATKLNERDMLLHVGNCKHCSATWKALQETALFIPETADEPSSELVNIVMQNLTVQSRKNQQCEATLSRFVIISFVLLLTGAYTLLAGFIYTASQGLFQLMSSALGYLGTIANAVYRGLLYFLGKTNLQVLVVIGVLLVVVMLFSGAYAGIKKVPASENREFDSPIV